MDNKEFKRIINYLLQMNIITLNEYIRIICESEPYLKK